MKLLRGLFLSLVIALLAGGGYGLWYALAPVEMAAAPTEVEIQSGWRLRRVAAELERSGIRVGAVRFEILGRLVGRAETLRAGSYEIQGPLSPLELLDQFARGESVLEALVIPEGWTFAQLRQRLDAEATLRHDSAGLSDAQVLARVGVQAAHPEGRFFPDTYFHARGSSDLTLLKRAARAMERHLEREWNERGLDVPLRSMDEALVLASIIEKETGVESDRGRIGGVLANRLRIGMLLQADPTVIYGIGPSFDGNLRKADLLRDGPYNTYTRPGLPPTAICLPGLASIRAAMRPEKTVALFYVARGDGSSEFSRTLDEHNRAVNRYQRVRAGTRKN